MGAIPWGFLYARVEVTAMGYRRVSYVEQLWYILRWCAREAVRMPRKPKKPCRWPGCPNLTDDLYCAEHATLAWRQYDRFERSPDVHKKYGRAWTRIRNRYAMEHPLCERCLEEGRLTPVQEVHHIVPVSKGGTHDRSNLMSLCQSCHTKIHLEMGDRQIRQ